MNQSQNGGNSMSLTRPYPRGTVSWKWYLAWLFDYDRSWKRGENSHSVDNFGCTLYVHALLGGKFKTFLPVACVDARSATMRSTSKIAHQKAQFADWPTMNPEPQLKNGEKQSVIDTLRVFLELRGTRPDPTSRPAQMCDSGKNDSWKREKQPPDWHAWRTLCVHTNCWVGSFKQMWVTAN